MGPKPDVKLDSRYRLPLQSLSPAQMEERRRKGLFFNYDKKFQPGHQCKLAKLFLLKGLFPFQEPSSNVQLVEFDESEATLLPLDEDNFGDNKSDIKKGVAKITLYALLGSPSPGTIRVMGKINGH